MGRGAGMPMADRPRGVMGGQGMMRGRGVMGDDGGRGGMRPHLSIVTMALIDTDASGTLSLEEVQAVHARLFRYVDTDDDGQLTTEELRAFIHGEAIPAAQ